MPDVRQLKILRLVDGIGETTAPYNQFTLPWIDQHRITICSFFEPWIEVAKEVRVFHGGGTLRGVLRAMRSALKQDRYDVIHSHSYYISMILLFLKLVSFDARNIPTVFTVHSSFENLKCKHRLMLVFIMVFFSRIICCGRASYDSMPFIYKFLGGKRLSYIPNGVDIDRIDRVLSQNPFRNDNTIFTVVTVGRLISLKNHVTILRALKLLKCGNSRLIIIGEGDCKEQLIVEAQKLDISGRVIFTGLLSRDETFRRIAEADIFVSASFREGLPVAVLEAMACYKPVVLSDIPPHREIAEKGRFIPLFKPRDERTLCLYMEQFASMDTSRLKEIGLKCRRLVEEQFSLTKMFKAYDRIFREISLN